MSLRRGKCEHKSCKCTKYNPPPISKQGSKKVKCGSCKHPPADHVPIANFSGGQAPPPAAATPSVTPQPTAGSALGIAPKAATTALAYVSPLPKGWEECTMPDGKKYYVDHNTHTSTWHRPGDPLPTTWELRKDSRTGRDYYAERNTQTTTWDRPSMQAVKIGLSMTQKLACYTKPEGDDLGIIVHDDLYVLHDSKGLRITGVALKKVAYSLLKGKDIKLLDVVIEVNKQPVISLPAPFGDVVKRMGSSSLVVDHSVSMDLPPDILDQLGEVEDSGGTHVFLLHAGNSPSLSEQEFGLRTTAGTQGCTVSNVVQGSIAWKNGLREGDVILAYCVEYQGIIDRLNLNPRQSFFDADLQHAVKGSKSMLIVIKRPLPGAESVEDSEPKSSTSVNKQQIKRAADELLRRHSRKGAKTGIPCRLPGCGRDRLWTGKFLYDFCCKEHCLGYAAKHCFLCDESKLPSSDFCGEHSKKAATGTYANVMQVSCGSDVFKKVTQLFRNSWAEGDKGEVPPIKGILRIINPMLSERFAAYISSLPPSFQRVEQYFHGTNLACDAVPDYYQLCDGRCGVCGIAKNGFDYRFISSDRWQRFGGGFYFAPNASKSAAYFDREGDSLDKDYAMLVCDIAPGNKHMLELVADHLTSPPEGYHSVYGRRAQGPKHVNLLNYDELVIYNRNAICPRYVIIYKEDKTKK